MNKLTRKRFLQIWVPLAVILLITVLCCTLLMNAYSALMDLHFGKGNRKVVNLSEKGLSGEYYSSEFESAKEAAENGKKLTEEISNEGIVLLKNNGVLPLAEGSKVTPFGYHYLFPNYGPSSGSAMTWSDDLITPEQAFEAVYEINETVVGKMKKATAYGLTEEGYFVGDGENACKADVMEYAPEIYGGAEESCGQSVGVVFIGRIGGEGLGADMTVRPLYDGTPHAAALSTYERRMLGFSKRNCKKTIVVINGCNPMELSPVIANGELEADAVLWVGGTGSAGFKALANIMTGEICPSGRLTDIYVTDSTKNPVYANYGDFYKYSNVKRDYVNYIFENFVEYEEGIYNGYRYYETAAVEDPDFEYGKLDKQGALISDGVVTYPFGYGLSYSQFEQKITNFSVKDNGKIQVAVSVKNTGKVAAKDVVQIYYSAPYTYFSEQMRMEKSAVNLAGFAKTKLLEPEEEQIITVAFDIEDMASYSSARDNGDGTFGCYILEMGQYVISLRNNSHDVFETRYLKVPDTVYYDNSNPRKSEKEAQYASDKAIAATNKFDTLTRYMKERTTVLSRADWAGTQPKSPENFTAPDYVLDVFENTKNFNPAYDAALGAVEGSGTYNPTPIISGAKNGMVVSSLRGADYNDPAWDKLLDELNFEDKDLLDALHLGYMQTGKIDSIGLPSAEFRDGPLGITASMSDLSVGVPTVHNSYCAMPVLAATFNTELAYRFGQAVAEEAFWNNEGKTIISGWYAPGMNVHRGPFGGRYYEYFSEDPLLIGLIAAGVSSGAADKGLSVVIKHFAANNQDSARSGLNTWMTEQTLREIYLRPYEICIKNAKSQLKYISGTEYAVKTVNAVRGIMTAKNCLGATFCGINYPLVTEVLKGEWNFNGMVITDYYSKNSGAFYAKSFCSGVNVLMCVRFNVYADGMLDTYTAKHILRESVHSLCYTVANSNAMQGVPPGAVVVYGISPWLAVMIALNALVVCFIISMTLITCFVFKKSKTTAADKLIKIK